MSRHQWSIGYAAIALVLSTGLVACGGAAAAPSEAPSEAESTAAVLPADTAQPEAPSAPAGSRDFAAIDVCELVTPEEVAELGGGAVQGEPNQQSAAEYSMCWYYVELPTGADTYYIVYVEQAELGEMALDLGETGDPVPGLGDESRLWFEEAEDQFRLLVIRRGDYALDLAGTFSEAMVEIARLLIERLG